MLPQCSRTWSGGPSPRHLQYPPLCTTSASWCLQTHCHRFLLVISFEMPAVQPIDFDHISLFPFHCGSEEATIEPSNEAWEISIREKIEKILQYHRKCTFALPRMSYCYGDSSQNSVASHLQYIANNMDVYYRGHSEPRAYLNIFRGRINCNINNIFARI